MYMPIIIKMQMPIIPNSFSVYYKNSISPLWSDKNNVPHSTPDLWAGQKKEKFKNLIKKIFFQ